MCGPADVTCAARRTAVGHGDPEVARNAAVSVPSVLRGTLGWHHIPSEHDVVADGKNRAIREANAVGDALDAEAVHRLRSGADHDWGDSDDDPIDESGGEQSGDHLGATLDQNRLSPSRAQHRERGSNGYSTLVLLHDLNADTLLAER
jgi:hypothetical protein